MFMVRGKLYDWVLMVSNDFAANFLFCSTIYNYILVLHLLIRQNSSAIDRLIDDAQM